MSKLSSTNSLEEWLEVIEAAHPSEIDLGLDRVAEVAGRLNLDFSRSKVITVAGTNGKGSTCAMLDSILRASDFTTGVYSSPHFLNYNERIKINGLDSSDEVIVDAFCRIDQAREEISLTYFEYGTLAALIIFSDLALDYVILEVGLGGRLDAVNIVDADIAVITSIALDHIDWLGDDIESIAREKAGIFRPNKPAVCAMSPAARSIVQHSAELNAPLYQFNQDYRLDDAQKVWNWSGVDLKGEHIAYFDLQVPPLPLINAATVLQVLTLIAPEVSIESIASGLESVHLTGRMQSETIGVTECLLDVAHNPQAAEYLADRLQQQPKPSKRTLVLGMLNDKDRQGVIEALRPITDEWYLVSLQGPRASQAEELVNLVGANNPHQCFASVSEALDQLSNSTSESEQVLICGSFLTVTEALSWLKTH
ncbi:MULTISPECIES: bifunctional tetrahydrofolate synthase/dihydrofolate synthase [unclassified Marinobacterium]|uniref:bifunctional tetrahydrofolate synthase/dihydrofolate synthase n=1 Tax=unclassified Marinobacterium TaxID=2644139 RepID=UPI001569F1FB|nr:MULTISPECIES: bifunctional tetrahydrofolate synthase/dihydrofolate synthase [unclassified Marinobacterium]NRP09776.1 Bifunctional protein FolC [Marinobacterium sp. xm-g-48]NRP28041.1 Bifunctional protein FolC [Marinobacterium sp. xm-d-420]NRP51863.1 Bifunctional protein FolC [Marinobacterium sp. xm-v-242]NRP57669.1 Bifunctional protein FolC [Marinobacterium sp. xm-d-510]NRP76444.1 Bifunctional protein FolC [Marinobacterium sp. xm-m-383]